MATRYYPTRRPTYSYFYGGAKGTWANQSLYGRSWHPKQTTYLLSTSKTNGGTASLINAKCNQQGNYDFYFFRFATPPLAAQSISGTFDLCYQIKESWIDAILSPADSSVVKFKLHIYISVGQTTEVRSVLLDNYIDATQWPFRDPGDEIWTSLTSAQALAGASALEGDSIIVEIGARIVSSPTPAATYPPTNYTFIPFRGYGTATTDATAGSTDDTLSPWFEFSATITESATATPDPPANDACADAITISSLPYESSAIQTFSAVDGAWWKYTAASSGTLLASTFGSNYSATIAAYTGGCGVLTPVVPLTPSSPSVNGTIYRFSVTAGVEYLIKVTNSDYTAGQLKLQLSSVDSVPDTNDLYLPNGLSLYHFRDGQLIDAIYTGYIVTGIAIDYTKREMIDITSGTNSNDRLFVGLFAYELVEIYDINDFHEVDYIGNPWYVAGASIHPAQLAISSGGTLYSGWFGDGFLYVAGQGTSTPSIYNTVSSNTDYSAIKVIDAISADNQGGSYSDTLITPAIEIGAPWAIALDEANGIIYYTTGGLYEPVGGQQIKRWSLTSGQLSDFATITLNSGKNPGIKGICVLPDGGLLVCNSTVVHRLNSSGTITQTYTPSNAIESQSLCDVKLEANGQYFWVVDEATVHLFKFNLATGVESKSIQTNLIPGTLVQMALYNSSGEFTPPESVPGTITVVKSATESPALDFTFTAGSLTPISFTLSDGESQVFTSVPIGSGYSIVETIPEGWTVVYTVSNGSLPTNITVSSGESVLITVTNTLIPTPGVTAGGIYKIVPGKRDDTLWLDFSTGTKLDVKIPDPYVRTGLIGE